MRHFGLSVGLGLLAVLSTFLLVAVIENARFRSRTPPMAMALAETPRELWKKAGEASPEPWYRRIK